MTKTTILIAEDSRTQAETLRSLLDEHGYGVTVASNGEDALALLAEQRFDMVVSDIMMPGMDGYELCRTIKAHPEHRHVPVLLLTSLRDPMDIIRGLENGADNFLTKPYEPAQLLDRIGSILENRRLRGGGLQMGLAISFLGQSFTITAEKQQILDLLVSTFEDAVLRNRQLAQREEELERARAELAGYAGTLEDRIERVLESVPDIVYSVNADRRELHYMSRACSRITGFEPSYFAADPATRWDGLIAEQHRLPVVSIYERVAATGGQETVEYPIHAADNTVRWVEETIVAVRGPGDTVLRLDCVARDITRRRQLEEQVRLAQKMEAVGTLAGGIAHDFNNLLSAIQGNAELASFELPEDSPIRTDLDEIIQVTRRATMVTRQLLALGRRQVMEPAAVDVQELIIRSTTMLRRFIGDDIEFLVVKTDQDVTVWADPNQVDQVLMNLCINARHAMPGGGELIIATDRLVVSDGTRDTYPELKPGEYVSVSVSDTGTGMTEEVRARIFEPFFTTKDVGEGTGLGLAVVHGIIEQHGGAIRVDSEPGRGTTFRFCLPFHAEAQPAVQEPVSTALPGGSETILYVEDDEAVRKVTVRRLRKLGYDIVEAMNGAEALDVLGARGNEIELVMTDVMMPTMGGVELFQRTRETHDHLKFLFMTGFSPSATQVAPLPDRSRGASVLYKPFSLHELASRIRQILDRPGP